MIKSPGQLPSTDSRGNFQVVFDDTGLRLEADGVVRREMKWADIGSIWAYKIDCFAFDIIALGICEARWPIEMDVGIEEGTGGFLALSQEVERRFSIDSNWFGKVMVPAFETNLTRLWPLRSHLAGE